MDLLVCANDFPAGAVLMYGMGSTSAFKYCKACDADTRVGDPTKPFSFLRRLLHSEDDEGTGWKLRTIQSVRVREHYQCVCSMTCTLHLLMLIAAHIVHTGGDQKSSCSAHQSKARSHPTGRGAQHAGISVLRYDG